LLKPARRAAAWASMTIALGRNGTKRPSKAAEIEAVPTKNKPAAGAGAIAGAAPRTALEPDALGAVSTR